MHEITRASEHVWHIAEIEETYFSIIRGGKSAIVVDTAYGIGDNRGFVEHFLEGLPYIVINTHGHNDHVSGDYQFDKVWIHPADLPAYQNANKRMFRMGAYFMYAKKYDFPAEKKDEYVAVPKTEVGKLSGHETYDLGGVTVSLHHLPGHTKGEIGLLVNEARLLLSGDSFSDDCYMFADNHDSLETLQHTVEKALTLPFDFYLGSHTTKPLPQTFLKEVLANTIERKVVPGSEETILGVKTVTILNQGPDGISKIRVQKDSPELA